MSKVDEIIKLVDKLSTDEKIKLLKYIKKTLGDRYLDDGSSIIK